MGRECFNSLRDKDVINGCDGKRLGFVNDLEIDACSGKICALIVLFDYRLLGFGKYEELVIPWERICRIGKDTIIVDIGIIPCGDNCKKPKI